MEKEGFIRTLNKIREVDGLDIRVVSTDKHNQIKKLMRSSFQTHIASVCHWHVSKSIMKKILVASKVMLKEIS